MPRAESTDHGPRRPRHASPGASAARRGKALLTLLIGGAVVAGAAGIGWLFWDDSSQASSQSRARDIHTVSRGEFQVVIPASGELEALRSIKVVNRLEQRAVLTWIIPEGTLVKSGDVLFRLADEEIRNRIKDAEDVVKTAEAGLVAAQTALSVRQSAAASEQSRAALTVTLAELALEAWEKGEETATRENLTVAVESAQINYDRLVKKYEESQQLVKDEHISLDECERDRIEMIEARARLQTAKLALEVYTNYTFKQDKARIESDVEQAQAELGRVKQRNEAEIGNDKAALDSAQYKVVSARERLEDLEQQLGYCTVTAPSGGLVVYATSLESGRWGGGGERSLQVGTELRPNEEVIILPDTSQMVAAVKVNEALTGRIRVGQQVTVVSDALPNVPLRGEVSGIGVLAEQGGWRDPNRRDYTVRVLLADAEPSLGLKPSMRCKAEIIVDSVDDALHVPIQAVFRDGGSAFVYVSEPGGIARRTVRAARASELEIEIVQGLSEGDRVLLRAPEPSEMARAPVEVAKADGAEAGPTAGSGSVERTGAVGRGGRGEGARPGRGAGEGAAASEGRPRAPESRDVAAVEAQPTS